MKRNIAINDLDMGSESDPTQKVRVNEGDAWYDLLGPKTSSMRSFALAR